MCPTQENASILKCVSITVIQFQRYIILISIDLNICIWLIDKEQLILFPLVPFFPHMSCITEHIVVEDDSVKFHFLQVCIRLQLCSRGDPLCFDCLLI